MKISRKGPWPVDCGGFTYTAMIVAVVIVGIMLGAAGQLWSTTMKREKEDELIFRGLMIRNAIERWYNPMAGQAPVSPLQDLKDLVKDPRALQTVRRIPRIYEDPMTGKEWRVIKDGSGGIIGVASTSTSESLKSGGFPDELKTLEGKHKYSDWEFVYVREGEAAQTTQAGQTQQTQQSQ